MAHNLPCPDCGRTESVYPSRVRGLRERMLLRLVPFVGVYRCHRCNWRGWMPRRRSTRRSLYVTVGGFAAVGLAILIVAVILIVNNWPAPKFDY